MGWGLHNEYLVLTVQKPGKSMIKVLAEMVPMIPFSGLLIVAFFLFPHMVQKERERERERNQCHVGDKSEQERALGCVFLLRTLIPL